MANKTTISLMKETPSWAKWMFRITFLVTTALTGWIAATSIIPDGVKYELTLFLKLFLDPIIYGVSKMFGVSKERDDNEMSG